ncbi:MAG: tyrosine--tRNA ligase [Elusimicrobia bacterium]|nr:tyrosine--tRNA ligase [Elusimicrobiota bacterium]
MKSIEEQIEILKKGCVNIIEEEEIKEKLREKRPLRVKFGADPSSPDLHLGHLVVLNKLREFGELGHKIIFIIGDFTARIGDPSGQKATRPVLSKEDVLKNAQTYQKQIFRILDKSYTEIVYNSRWLEKMSLEQIFQLTSKYTIARMLERRDFRERFEKNQDIYTTEFLYPLLQGYDSVYLKADVEIGGEDQIFNLLVGRTLQQKFSQKPQVVMTLPLLVGTDGEKKMSKSYNNYIGITEEPQEIYGKVMSISDKLMYDWIKILTFVDGERIKSLPPRQGKALLAFEIVKFLYDEEKAKKAQAHFEKVIVNKDLPEEIREVVIKEKKLPAFELVYCAGLCQSKTQAKQLISQGGFSADGKKIADFKKIIEIKDGMILKAGKRNFAKIKRG